MTGDAPDYVEPVVGWRTWLVVKERDALVLRSVVFETVWRPRRELVARCEARRGLLWRRLRNKPHETPSVSCECGIYAAREIAHVAGYLTVYEDLLRRSVVHRVLGQVSLWGTVVEGERGWRASHAYPARIYVPPRGTACRRVDPLEVALELGRYGVPVEILDDGVHEDAERVLAELAQHVAE
jgi:hypothetical protein